MEKFTPNQTLKAELIKLLQTGQQLNVLEIAEAQIKRHRREYETLFENIDNYSLNVHDFHERLIKLCSDYGYNYQVELHNSRSMFARQKPQMIAA